MRGGVWTYITGGRQNARVFHRIYYNRSPSTTTNSSYSYNCVDCRITQLTGWYCEICKG